MMAEAMKYAVIKLNNDSNYLFGYKLNIDQIIDINTYEVQPLVLETFLMDIPFLIGPNSPEKSYITSILTSTLGQIAISYSATYSDFGLSDNFDNNILRTVPSDTYRVQAVLDLIHKLKWNYVAVISSYGYNGERDSRHFIAKLSEIGVCLADQIYLPIDSAVEADKAIKTVSYDNRLKALVLFTTNIDSSRILSAIQKHSLNNRFYLLCVFGCTNYIEVIQGKGIGSSWFDKS